MRMTTMVLAAAILAATSISVFAQTEPAPASAQTQAAPVEPTAGETPEEAELICRVTQRAESRLRSRRERTCMTQSQWDALADQTARDVRAMGQVQGAKE